MFSDVQELVAAKLPNLHRHLQSIGCDMTIIGATDWILCLYTTSLPAEVSAISPLPAQLLSGLSMSAWDAVTYG